MAMAEFPAGPSLSRRAVGHSRRLDVRRRRSAGSMRRRARPHSEEASSALALRGDIAMQRGDYATAREDYAKAEAAANNAGLRRCGNRCCRCARAAGAGASSAVLRGKRLTRLAKAQAAIQRATVAYAVGDWTTAGRWARFADGFFPGNWLNEAFVAQQAAVEGRPDEAAALRRYSQSQRAR